MIVPVILLGLIFGSFLSSVTWRIPRNIRILDLHSRSICPECHNVISWCDNIPLLSYLLLKGRCRHCHKPISLRYPLIEFSTVVLFVVLYFLTNAYSPVPSAYILWPIALLLLAIFVIDFEHQIIPDELSFLIIFLGVINLIFISPQFFYVNILSGLCAALFLLLTHLITKGKGMGLGDVKLVLAVGLILGWPGTLVWMYAAFLIGAVTGLILILVGKAKFRVPIAFGPFLALAFLVALLYAKIF
jgi:leader peptidase (prepilin peptidase)/N-methyltransferase